MTDNPGEAVVEQTADGVITGWDAPAEALFGWTRGEAVGMPSDRLVPARNRQRHADALHAFVTAPQPGPFHRAITALHRDGREFPIATTFSLNVADSVSVVTRARASSGDAARPAGPVAHRDARYLAILDQIEDGCCAVDLRGNFLFVNDAFCHIFGFTREFILGRNFTASMGAERADTLRDQYMQVYKTGVPVKSFECRIYPQNSSARHVEQTISLERDAAGKPIGFLAIIRDCTARKEAQLEAVRAREAAETANRTKGEFLANMSHEIRTPMNGIIGMTELALGSQLTPYQADCLHTVKTSAQNLLTILNDVLDFSKIESRKLTLEAVPFALAEAMGDVLKLLAIRARQKGIELLYDVDPRTPPGLVGDPVRLRQIVTNLVGNAIKFTDRGRVVLSIHEETRHERRTTLHFSVLDTGIGIPGDKHAAIFEAFSQADGSTTRRFGGTGLGLAISSTLVQMMGGRIWVESEPDAGSVFHFTAAFDVAPETAANVARTAAGPAAAKRRVKVLVAEDNLVNQRVVSGLLSKRGHLVTLAGNGLEAIAALERGQFDVVLMDVQMPEMGGFEATAAIRARERDTGSHIRIVAMTAHAMSGDRERCIASGMDGYLSKPIDMRMLFTIVEENAPPVLGSEPHAMTTGRLRQTAT